VQLKLGLELMIGTMGGISRFPGTTHDASKLRQALLIIIPNNY
jgi:hypothetical protein